MVAPIREYERQVGAQSADPGRRASAEDMGFGAGLQNLAQGVGALGDALQRYEENKEVSDAQLKMSESEAVWEERQNQLYNEAQPGVSVAKQLKTEMTTYSTQLAGNYKSEKARQYVQLHSTHNIAQRTAAAARFDVDLAVKDQMVKVDTLYDNIGKQVYERPDTYADKVASLEYDVKNGIGVFEQRGDARSKVALEKLHSQRIEQLAWMAAKGDIRNPAVRGMIVGESNPVESVSSNKPDNIISSVIRREGGYVANDAGRGETNFGINKTAHPGEDIKGMTADKAAEIYKRDYWDAYGVGNLPAAVQGVVFDGVVNHGEPFKTQLVQAAKNGASAQELGNMRLAEYKRLIDANPDKYAKYEKSWTTRVNESMAAVASTPELVDKPPELKQKPAWWDDLSPERQVSITNEARELNKREQRIADAALQNTLRDVDEYWKTTGKLPPNLPKASAFTDPVQYQKYQAFIDSARQLEPVMNSSPSVQQEMLAKMRPEYGVDAPGIYDYKMSVYNNAVRMVQDYNAKSKVDQVGHAYSSGFSAGSPINPIKSFEPDEFVKSMNERFPVSDAIATQRELPPKHLMNAEAVNMKKFVDGLSSQELRPWIDQVVDKTTDKAKLQQVFKQAFPNDHSMLVTADILLSKTATPEKANNDADMILLGRRHMQALPKGQGQEEEKAYQKAMLPSPSDAIRQISKFAGPLNIPEGQMTGLAEAVTAHYIGTARSKNTNQNLSLRDKELGVDNTELFNQSIQAILGKHNGSTVGTKAGSTVVLRPYGMDETLFMDRVQQAVDVAYQGKYKWGEYSLQITPDGKYQAFIAGKPPLTIDPTEEPYRDEGRNVPARIAPEGKPREPVKPVTRSLGTDIGKGLQGMTSLTFEQVLPK